MSNQDIVLNKDTLEYNAGLFRGSQNVIKQNEITPYKNTPEDKLKILEEVDRKFLEACNFSSDVKGNKNLLYYAVFGVDYTMLLELSLKTLINNEQHKNFDVLFITDVYTLKLIRSIECLKEFNWDYYLVSQPQDGVDASIAKLKIYSYPKIQDYSKILFIDTDVICKGDFSEVFKASTGGKLEVVKSPIVHYPMPNFPNLVRCAVLSHSLSFFTEKNLEYIIKNKPLVFNAGHFYFENTAQMQQHFNNVIWLMKVWPAAYFYEQSFMNQYFNLNNMASFSVLDKHIGVTWNILTYNRGLPSKLDKQHEDTQSLIHFAGTPTFGRNKYQFINRYCKDYNICL